MNIFRYFGVYFLTVLVLLINLLSFFQNGNVISPTRNTEPTLSMRKLSEKLTSVSLKNKTQPLVENDAFEGIGDDDL